MAWRHYASSQHTLYLSVSPVAGRERRRKIPICPYYTHIHARQRRRCTKLMHALKYLWHSCRLLCSYSFVLVRFFFICRSSQNWNHILMSMFIFLFCFCFCFCVRRSVDEKMKTTDRKSGSIITASTNYNNDDYYRYYCMVGVTTEQLRNARQKLCDASASKSQLGTFLMRRRHSILSQLIRKNAFPHSRRNIYMWCFYCDWHYWWFCVYPGQNSQQGRDSIDYDVVLCGKPCVSSWATNKLRQYPPQATIWLYSSVWGRAYAKDNYYRQLKE